MPYKAFLQVFEGTPQLPRPRFPIKFAWAPTWNFVHEQIRDPSLCEKGQFRTFTVSKSKGVLMKICCPKSTYFIEGKKGCFCDYDGAPVEKPVAQVLLHDVMKFKMRHPDIWAMLQKMPSKGKFGLKELPSSKILVKIRKVA